MQRVKPLILILFVALAASAAGAQTAEPPKEKPKARAETPAPDPWAVTMPMTFGEGSYLGVYLEEVTPERAKELGLKEERGALVMKVVEGSPAEKAGLKENDTIVSFNGKRVDSVREFQRMLGETPVGRSVTIEIWRGGSEQTISATLSKRSTDFALLNPGWQQPRQPRQPREPRRPDAPAAPRDFGDFNLFRFPRFGGFMGTRLGITIEPLTGQLAEYFGVKSGQGVLVTEVRANAPGAKGGLKAGDVITAVDGKKVENVDTLVEAITEKEEGQMTLTILRNRVEQTITVTIEKRRPTTRGSLLPSYFTSA
ncbi:MAG TPA: PDZ domain-containing protein [Blastocatellia bacterium]|nr:PDZ domain-containing protein [Blastocatellia bacterium]